VANKKRVCTAKRKQANKQTQETKHDDTQPSALALRFLFLLSFCVLLFSFHLFHLISRQVARRTTQESPHMSQNTTTNYSQQLKGEIHRCTCFFPFSLPSMLASLHLPSLPLLPLYLFRCCGCFTTPYESCLDEGSTSKLPFSHLDCTPECLSKPFTTTMPWESC